MVRRAQPASVVEDVRDDVFATACHKLRTPLTAAMGFLQLALRDTRRSGQTSPHLDMVDEQLRRLACLLDDLAKNSKPH